MSSKTAPYISNYYRGAHYHWLHQVIMEILIGHPDVNILYPLTPSLPGMTVVLMLLLASDHSLQDRPRKWWLIDKKLVTQTIILTAL